MLQKHEPKIESDDIHKRMDNCETAVRYQMYHALALLGLGVLSLHRSSTGFNAAGVLFALGIIGFSGGLYLFVFTGDIVHWAIVPSGGVLLICGWVAVAVSAARMSTSLASPAQQA